MPADIILRNLTNPITLSSNPLGSTKPGERDGSRGSGSSPPPNSNANALAVYDFANGDTLSNPSKNDAGMSFDNLNFPTGTSPEGKTGLLFRHGPDPILGDSWQELRYRYNGQYPELYARMRLYVPSNFNQRVITEVTMSGDVSGWLNGDVVQAPDGSRGTIVGKGGVGDQTVYLEDAENGYSTSTWGSGTMTNITRSLTATSTGRTTDTANNKLWAHWSDPDNYPWGGMNFEYWPRQTTFGTRRTCDLRVNANLTDAHGKGSNELSEAISGIPFFQDSDLGREVELTIRLKWATSLAAEDGIAEMWRDGELVYANRTMILWDANRAYFDSGYLLGWANSGFAEQTDFYVTLFEFYGANRPEGIN